MPLRQPASLGGSGDPVGDQRNHTTETGVEERAIWPELPVKGGELRCAAMMLLEGAAAGVGLWPFGASPAVCLAADGLEVAWDVLWVMRPAPRSLWAFHAGVPRPLAPLWATECRVARARVLLDAGVDVVGEARAPTSSFTGGIAGSTLTGGFGSAKPRTLGQGRPGAKDRRADHPNLPTPLPLLGWSAKRQGRL